MRFFLVTLGFALLGAIVGGIYGDVTWQPTCSPETIEPVFCSRASLIGLDAFVGVLIGALVGLVVALILVSAGIVKVERPEEDEQLAEDQRQGPGAEPNA